jgi:hypothetical protein
MAFFKYLYTLILFVWVHICISVSENGTAKQILNFKLLLVRVRVSCREPGRIVPDDQILNDC